jgi:hypothetical protein
VTRAGDGHVEIDPALVRAGRSELPTRIPTVYDEVLAELRSGGWTQGRDTHRSRLSLTAAIDVVVGSTDAPGPKAAALVRSARVRNHLSELAGVASLIAWNDDGERTFEDLETLLTMAAVAFPED